MGIHQHVFKPWGDVFSNNVSQQSNCIYLFKTFYFLNLFLEYKLLPLKG